MDVLRRNTDYALRAMIHLAGNWGKEPVSTRQVAQKEDVSYQLACKLMQRLNNAGLVRSQMGPKGGFQLSRKPSRINLVEVIEAIQGPLALNRCLLDVNTCVRQKSCPVKAKLTVLQKHIDQYLSAITLAELLQNGRANEKGSVGELQRRKK